MKHFLIYLLTTVLSLSVLSQGNSNDKGKGKDKTKPDQAQNSQSNKNNNDEERNKINEHNKKVWEGTYSKEGDGPKSSKNQPAKVRSSFQRDYPNARNVSWSKYRGDWTATFGNGVFMSTAIYHANGERRDTRTPITRNEMPRNVLDSIFKRRPGTRIDDVIKVEVPNAVKEIYRIREIFGNKPQYLYYNSDGIVVKYNY